MKRLCWVALAVTLCVGCRQPPVVVSLDRVKGDGAFINGMASRTPRPVEQPSDFEPLPYVPEQPAYEATTTRQACPGGVCGPTVRRPLVRRLFGR